ncbi:MAG: peptidoglycan D,D-transpeptidase FtsI family protein [Christensenellaceae bacterium]
MIAGRFFFVQVVDEKMLGIRAADQWTRELPLLAERGRILDRNGTVLAGNTPTYAIFVRRNAVTDREKVASLLYETLGIAREETAEKLEKKVSEYTAARGVSKEIVQKIEEAEIDGVYVVSDNTRLYPYGDLLCQVLGFTAADGTGLTGLEKAYDKYLAGENGELLAQTDLVGVQIDDVLLYKEAKAGLDLTLTIDYGIQTLVERVMKEAVAEYSPKSASCIVLDPNDFSVLAMANPPSYDLGDVPREDGELLNSLSRNNLVSNVYEPGSTFKILTAAIDLQEYLNGNKNAFSPDYVFPDSRTRIVDGTTVRCWSAHLGGNHSHQTLAQALNNSCNPCFTDIALSLGKETFYSYLTAFGLGNVTGIDFPGEAAGMLLPVSVVRNCDLARIGFGQSVAVSALQLACAAAAAVNGGNYYAPRLVKAIGSEPISPVLKNHPIGEEASSILREMLEGVVRDGSGKKAFIEGYRIGGKTGTAQKYEDGRIAAGKYVSSFVGFYPVDAPRYLVLVVIDEPQGAYYGSVVATPKAREIFEGIIQREEGDGEDRI